MFDLNRAGTKVLLTLVFVVGLGGLNGCVLSPRPGALLSDDPATGFATVRSAVIRVRAFNYRTNQYEVVGTGTSGDSPTVAAGTMCSNSPALYYYSVLYRITGDHLNRRVFPDPVGKLQLTQTQSDGRNQVLYSSTHENPVRCVLDNVKPGCDFYDVAFNICGFKLTEINFYTLG
jgi:hypothetical protein